MLDSVPAIILLLRYIMQVILELLLLQKIEEPERSLWLFKVLGPKHSGTESDDDWFEAEFSIHSEKSPLAASLVLIRDLALASRFS